MESPHKFGAKLLECRKTTARSTTWVAREEGLCDGSARNRLEISIREDLASPYLAWCILIHWLCGKKRGLQWSQDGFKILPTTLFYIGDDFEDFWEMFPMCLWLCDSKSSVNLWVLPSRKDLQPLEVWRVVGRWFVKKWNPPNIAAFLMLAVSWREQIGHFRNCNHI